MTSNPKIRTSPANPMTEPPTPVSGTNAYCPSVPISVYRELAGELQATQARVDVLQSQNQRLVQQNQQLKQEVQKVLQSAQHLQQLVYSFEVPEHPPQPVEKAPQKPINSVPVVSPPQAYQPSPAYQKVQGFSSPEPEFYASSEFSEPQVVEIPQPQPSIKLESDSSGKINGWLLALAIFLIMITAFGVAFMVVRPLINQKR